MIRAWQLRLVFAPIAAALAIGLAPAASPALAQDPRLVTLEFDESAVVTIRGKVKVQTTIKFAPDEQIENVAIGDSGAWQVQPNKAQTILFVKPLAQNAKTNMTVVTSQRTYLFDLVSSNKNAPLYVLQFRYPELEKRLEEERLAAEAQAETQRLEANAIEIAAATDPFAVSDPATFNFDWVTDGDAELLPARAYDNGQAVFLTWPEGTSIPAILMTGPDGKEGPVNYTVRGETVVLDVVPEQIILRSGEDTATLTNTNPPSANANNTRARGTRRARSDGE
ncbi:MAG: TrbG/VirB9 family P-type conjugative transfer protein [Pseudomonadota bacterium]